MNFKAVILNQVQNDFLSSFFCSEIHVRNLTNQKVGGVPIEMLGLRSYPENLNRIIPA